MLALIDATAVTHGPLELLFTIDEETGLTGAAQLDARLLSGRQLINLDSEDEGILYVGCAGGGDTRMTLDLATSGRTSNDVGVALSLTGLKGGHSGCDIHLQRGNALCLLARALWAAHLTTPFRLARLEGGSAHNAIPREAFATLVVDGGERRAVVAAIEAELARVRDEYRPADPNIQLAVKEDEEEEDRDAHTTTWDADTTATVLRLVTSLPHGVEAMSYDIPDLVETSTNLATVKPDNGSLVITTSSRSSIDAALEALRRRIRATGLLAGRRYARAPPTRGGSPTSTHIY